MRLIPTRSRIRRKEQGVSLIECVIILSLIFVVAIIAVPGLGHWTAKTLCEIPTLTQDGRQYSDVTNKCCLVEDSYCLGSPPGGGGCTGMFCG